MADKRDGQVSQDWDSLDFAALMQQRAAIFASIHDQVDNLLALDSALKRRAREMGLGVEVDYSSLETSLRKLTGGGQAARGPASRRPARRRGGKGRPERYQLMWKDRNEPVTDAEGNPVVFKSKVQVLRGPRYEELIGDRVGQVQLVDTFEDNAVVTEALRLGPAPGPRRG